MWPIIPWVCVAVGAGLMWFGWHGDMNPALAFGIQAMAQVILIVWVIVDVLDTGSAWWWILIAFLCGWIGLLVYFLSGRQE